MLFADCRFVPALDPMAIFPSLETFDDPAKHPKKTLSFPIVFVDPVPLPTNTLRDPVVFRYPAL